MEPSKSKPALFGRRIARWMASDGGIALMLALAISVLLFGMQPPITEGFDYQLAHQFHRLFLRDSIRTGELPLWNPYILLGRPFLADPETAVFYPPNWIFIVLPEGFALFLFLAFHFWLAGFFFLKLARRWDAPREVAFGLAFVYCLSGSLMGRLLVGQLGYFCGLAYWPLLFYLAERLRKNVSLRDWLALVLAASSSFLSGMPQCFWLTAVALGFYVVGAHLQRPWQENARRGLGCLGALASAYAFALVLCAVQLLPTIDLMLEGNRTGPDIQFSGWGPIYYRCLTSLYISQPLEARAWESNLYIGLICTVGGLLGFSQWRDARIRGLCLMGVIGFVLGLGQGTPLFAAMFRVLPGMGSFRMAARYATFLPWALLLAGLIAWAKGEFSRRKILFILGVLLAGAVYVILYSESYGRIGLIDAILLVVSILAVGWVKPQAWARVKVPASRILLALLCAGSLMAAARMQAGYSQLYVGKRLEAQVSDALHKRNLYPANGVPPRLFVPGSLIRPDSGVKYGFSSVAGECSLTSMRVWAYLHLGTGLPIEYIQVSFLPDQAYCAGPFPFPGMNIVLGAVDDSRKLFMNPHPGERAYLVYAWEQMPDWTASMNRLVSKEVDPTKTVLLEAPATGPLPMAQDKGRGRAVIESFRRSSITLHIESSSPALLVVAEAWYPGWRATVNGVPAEVLPANVWMRAVRVPAGESRVELHYVEPSLARGATISLGALLVLVAIGWRSRRMSSAQV
jgi:hypothetical protein